MPILNADYSNLNHETMAGAIGLKTKHIPMLIDSFTEESSTIMDNLKNAINSNEYENIKLHAHSIKGSAGNLKFNEVYEMAKEMELSAMENNASFDYMAYYEAILSAISTIK